LQAQRAKAMEATAPGTERVLLRKNGGGLGIRIRGGADTRHAAVYIEAVVPNLPAAQSGKIVAGDTLVAVNGVNLQGAPHATVIRLLQESPEETVLEVSARGAYMWGGFFLCKFNIFIFGGSACPAWQPVAAGARGVDC
jgi:C-terminal processing protease CtpA/Prc